MIRNLRGKLDALRHDIGIPDGPKGASEAHYRVDSDVLSWNDQAQFADFARIQASEATVIDPSCGGFYPRGALFLDTETTGLAQSAGTVAFLVGLGWLEDDGFHVEQHLLLDYPGEAELLIAVRQRILAADFLVTFNGKSFDLPLLASRMILSRLRLPEKPNIDLLHPARRMWQLRLKRCSLAHLETSVLGLQREADLSGAEVPQRFFQYLKTGEITLLDDVLRHNRQDIVSMAALMGRMAAAVRAPFAADEYDTYSMGRVMERAGRLDTAIACYRASVQPYVAWRARRSLMRIYRRKSEYAKVRDLLMEEAHDSPSLDAWLDLARLCEWRLHDTGTAIWAVDQAIEIAVRGRIPSGVSEDLARRKQRLEKKAGSG